MQTKSHCNMQMFLAPFLICLIMLIIFIFMNIAWVNLISWNDFEECDTICAVHFAHSPSARNTIFGCWRSPALFTRTLCACIFNGIDAHILDREIIVSVNENPFATESLKRNLSIGTLFYVANIESQHFSKLFSTKTYSKIFHSQFEFTNFSCIFNSNEKVFARTTFLNVFSLLNSNPTLVEFCELCGENFPVAHFYVPPKARFN